MSLKRTIGWLAATVLSLAALGAHAQGHARLARRERRRQQQHQLFAAAAAAADLFRSASLAISPSMPLAPISCAKLLR